MGLKETVEWSLVVGEQEAQDRFEQALRSLELEVTSSPGRLTGIAKRSLRRNRWAAEVALVFEARGGGSMVLATVDMTGNKHFEILDEIAEAAGDTLFEDSGIDDAIERLGKLGRVFGRKEVRHLRHIIRAGERVVELGQGTYGDKQGLLVLTNERLFFFEKSLMNQTVEEFEISAISSIEAQKKMSGERLVIHASGNKSEIKNMSNGQSDAISRGFRSVKQQGSTPAAPAAPAPAAPDVLDQIAKLSSLKDAGVLTEEEFQTKKADLLDRL